MINIQGCYQTMNIVTVNTVTLHLLSSIAAYILGPALVQVPSPAAKITVEGFSDYRIYDTVL